MSLGSLEGVQATLAAVQTQVASMGASKRKRKQKADDSCSVVDDDVSAADVRSRVSKRQKMFDEETMDWNCFNGSFARNTAAYRDLPVDFCAENLNRYWPQEFPMKSVSKQLVRSSNTSASNDLIDSLLLLTGVDGSDRIPFAMKQCPA